MIVDAHNDLLLELVHRRREPNPFANHWLGNLRAGGVGLQVCPIYAGLEHLPEGALRRGLEQVAACHRAIHENRDAVVLVQERADLKPVESGARLGLMLSMEGVEPFGYDPETADIFWELGVRMVALTWNRRNAFADGLGEPGRGGLSRLGEQLVDRLVGLGAILDLAHASEQTFEDVLERASGAVVVVSHGACRSILETPRNLSDDQLRAIAERDGVFGVMCHPSLIDPKRPTVDRLIDHIDHAVEVMGIDHVGLGGDFVFQLFGSGAAQVPPDVVVPEGLPLDAIVPGLPGPEGYPTLVEALRARGYDGTRLEALLSGNLLRLFRLALPGHD